MSSTDPIIRQGANARAIGRSQFENPYYRSENMPATTGEATKDWEAKAQMWEFGWKLEDALRTSGSELG